ncbi:preprotein translocase subunit SecD [Streptomyces alboflavus]|uniref:Preprotein translocase subunit SecD n=1 Tax=Streptomyces alboflavus TaxID=67267 RepID=A0A1Z1WR81_9ACTN|nr:preprotein translocase subunit SecD [Streptomyces alboflavus]
MIRTLPRTVNTRMGALFVLAALAVLGGDSLADFSVALIAGVIVGVASTVSVAVPVAVSLERRNPAHREGGRHPRSRTDPPAPGGPTPTARNGRGGLIPRREAVARVPCPGHGSVLDRWTGAFPRPVRRRAARCRSPPQGGIGEW